MKRACVWILVLGLLMPTVGVAETQWPADMEPIRTMVKKAIGDVPFDRVKVKRIGNETQVSIKLENVPPAFRELARAKATEDDVFLATNVLELFEPDFSTDIMGFNLTPAADLLTYFYGYVAFNFGKRIKLQSEIAVRNLEDDTPEIRKKKKKRKLNKNTLTIVCVEDTVESEGFYELYTKIGPWEALSYFCVGLCG